MSGGDSFIFIRRLGIAYGALLQQSLEEFNVGVTLLDDNPVIDIIVKTFRISVAPRRIGGTAGLLKMAASRRLPARRTSRPK